MGDEAPDTTEVEAHAEAVYSVAPGRRITFWSPAAERLTGYRASQVLGRRCADGFLRHVDGSGRPLCGKGCPLTAALTTGKAQHGRFFICHARGHRIPVFAHVEPVFMGASIVGAIQTFSDCSSTGPSRDRGEGEVNEARPASDMSLVVDESLEALRVRGLPAAVVLVCPCNGASNVLSEAAIAAMTRTVVANTSAFERVGRWDRKTLAVVSRGLAPDAVTWLARRIRPLLAATLVAGLELRAQYTLRVLVKNLGPNDTRATLATVLETALAAPCRAQDDVEVLG